MKKFSCPQCLKSFPKEETDHCEKCGQRFCSECLTGYGELVFCEKCK
jgi:hypothetical protein